MPKRRRAAPAWCVWTEAEDDVLRELYADLAADRGTADASREVAAELHRRGVSRRTRTPQAVKRRAHSLKIRIRKPAVPSRPVDELRSAALDLVRDLRGLPLTYVDFVDVLGIHPRKVKEIIEPLVEEGTVERIEWENGVLLFRDPAAWREGTAA